MVKRTGPEGIRGWLLLFTIGFVLHIILFAYFLVFFLATVVGLIIDEDPLPQGVMLVICGLLLVAITLLVQLFMLEIKRSKAFLKWVKWYCVASIILPPFALGNLVWLLYFEMSKRAKNTFIK